MPERPSAGPETWTLWPRAPHPVEGTCAGAGGLSKFLWFGNDGGRGKGLGFSEKLKFGTQGSPLSIEGLPRVQQVTAGHSSFQEKMDWRNRCPALDGGPGKQEAEAAEGSARHGCGCSQLNSGPAAKNYLLYWRKVFR